MSLESRLIGQLLKHGERDTVIEYFERLAQNGSSDAERPRKAAQDLRAGDERLPGQPAVAAVPCRLV